MGTADADDMYICAKFKCHHLYSISETCAPLTTAFLCFDWKCVNDHLSIYFHDLIVLEF